MQKLLIVATVSLLALAPAGAQQNQPSQAPHLANPTGTSSPPEDPFKNAGRPESHGGTVHSPQVGAGAGPLAPDTRQAVEGLARNTTVAQQYGNLASMRHASGAVHELGDRMIVTNSRINNALAAAHPELRGAEMMSADERGTFDNLARHANEAEFGVSVAQWVSQTYPQAISALERLAGNSQFRELARDSLPELRAQLGDANRILQTASNSPSSVESKQPSATGSVGAQEGSKPRQD